MTIELPERDRWSSAADVAAMEAIRQAVFGRSGPVMIRIAPRGVPIKGEKVTT